MGPSITELPFVTDFRIEFNTILEFNSVVVPSDDCTQGIICGTCQMCLRGICVPDLSQNGRECDDNDPFTNPDQCTDGICRGNPLCDCGDCGVCSYSPYCTWEKNELFELRRPFGLFQSESEQGGKDCVYCAVDESKVGSGRESCDDGIEGTQQTYCDAMKGCTAGEYGACSCTCQLFAPTECRAGILSYFPFIL